MIEIPFKSKAQQGFMFAEEARGKLPKGTAERWAKHTPDIKGLPEHVGKEKEHKVGNPLDPQDVFDEMAGIKKK